LIGTIKFYKSSKSKIFKEKIMADIENKGSLTTQTTTVAVPVAHAAAAAAAATKKSNGAKTCLVISSSITGALSVICFIAMFVFAPLLFGGIAFAIICAILGIIQCATGNCCCGAKDE
jgi:hypothetical protein